MVESREGQAVRLGSLDTLRGVAILGVIAFHTSISYPNALLGLPIVSVAANLGVQLFFLVSAYTMCTMWHVRRAEPYRVTNFYIRRLCRIGPLYWAALVFYGLFRGWQSFPDTLANLVMVHSMVPSAINSVVPGGWSIGVEVAFYAVLPLIVSLPQRLLLPIGMVWFVVIGLGVEQILARSGVDGLFLFYSPLTQLPVFLIGMRIFDQISADRGKTILLDIGCAAVWIVLAIAARHEGLPGRPAFWLAVFAMAAIAGAVIRFRIDLIGISFLGRLSYSMYLFHFAVIDIVQQQVGQRIGSWGAFALILGCTTLVAYGSFSTAERWSQVLARRLIVRDGMRRTASST